jgi:hypothetical protein
MANLSSKVLIGYRPLEWSWVYVLLVVSISKLSKTAATGGQCCLHVGQFVRRFASWVQSKWYDQLDLNINPFWPHRPIGMICIGVQGPLISHSHLLLLKRPLFVFSRVSRNYFIECVFEEGKPGASCRIYTRLCMYIDCIKECTI